MNNPDIREGLADHENRISEIEASLYYPDGLTPQVRLDRLEKIVQEISNSNRLSPRQEERLMQQDERLMQLQNLFLILERRIKEQLGEPKEHKPKQSPKGPVPL